MQEEEFLKRYIEFCRQNCSPRLTDAAAATLASEYVELRSEVGPCPLWAACLEQQENKPCHVCARHSDHTALLHEQ